MPEEGAKPHILVVDDENSIRLSLMSYLEDSGFAVSDAESGTRALEMLETEHYDAIILDLSMPGLSGLDVMRTIAERKLNLPIIVCSGTGAFKDAVEALRLGAWDFVSKPIPHMNLLNHTLSHCLERAAYLREKDRMLDVLEAKVKERTAELQAANSALEQKNLALREILFVSRSETERLRGEVSANVERLLQPKLSELRKALPDNRQALMDEIQEIVERLATPFASRLTRLASALTPAEVRICELIRQGLPNKEIAERTHLSVDTISSHRRNIRRKLGLNNQGISLASYLGSMGQDVEYED